MKKENIVATILTKKGLTLSIAESCTGGLVCHRLTDIPGSSLFLRAGLVPYSNEAKTRLLQIPSGIIQRYGAVSFETSTLMAQKVRKLFKTDFGIGISGIAGPTGGTKKKPIGLVFIAVSSKNDTLSLKCQFKGSRTRIKEHATTQALTLLEEFIQ